MSRNIDPNSTAQKILALLDEGPALTNEIAAELGIKCRLISAQMSSLRRRGKVTSRPFAAQRKDKCVNRVLWSLVE